MLLNQEATLAIIIEMTPRMTTLMSGRAGLRLLSGKAYLRKLRLLITQPAAGSTISCQPGHRQFQQPKQFQPLSPPLFAHCPTVSPAAT